MTIKESIEKLGKKLTGKDIHGTSISDVVSEVGDNFEGGSGGVVFEIVTEMGGETGVTIVSAEKTPDEVEQLLYKGTCVRCKLPLGGQTYLLTMERTAVGGLPEKMAEYVKEGIYPCGYASQFTIEEGEPKAGSFPLLMVAPDNTWKIVGL